MKVRARIDSWRDRMRHVLAWYPREVMLVVLCVLIASWYALLACWLGAVGWVPSAAFVMASVFAGGCGAVAVGVLLRVVGMAWCEWKLLALRWLDATVLVLVAVVVVFVVDAGTDLFAWLGRVLDVAAGRSASAVYCVGAAASVVVGAVLVLPLVRGDRRKAVPELTLPAAVRVAASVLLARPTVLAGVGAVLLAGFDEAHVASDLGRADVWPWVWRADPAFMPASLAAVLVLMSLGSGGLLLAVGLHGSWRVRKRDAKRRRAQAERARRAAEHATDVLADRGDSPFVDFKDLREWFESDDPITHPDEDRFEHRFVAHAVARKIDGFSADRFKPASMQILGPRGSGKSSLMAMVEYYLNHPHARPTREAAGSGVVATEGTQGTEAGENNAAPTQRIAAQTRPDAARNEPDAARVRRVPYIVTSVSLWEFTSAEAAMRAILRALVDAIGERAPTADLLSVPSRYAAVVAAPGGLWALAGAVLAGAIEPEDLIARIGRRAVAAGVNVLLWIDDLERFETSETDTLTKLGALLTLMRRTEGLGFVIARSPSAVPATGEGGAAKAGFDFEKVVDATALVTVDRGKMCQVLGEFIGHCLLYFLDQLSDAERKLYEAGLQPPNDTSLYSWAIRLAKAHPDRRVDKASYELLDIMAEIVATPRVLKALLRRVYLSWGERGTLCGEIDLVGFIAVRVLLDCALWVDEYGRPSTYEGPWVTVLSDRRLLVETIAKSRARFRSPAEHLQPDRVRATNAADRLLDVAVHHTAAGPFGRQTPFEERQTYMRRAIEEGSEIGACDRYTIALIARMAYPALQADANGSFNELIELAFRGTAKSWDAFNRFKYLLPERATIQAWRIVAEALPARVRLTRYPDADMESALSRLRDIAQCCYPRDVISNDEVLKVAKSMVFAGRFDVAVGVLRRSLVEEAGWGFRSPLERARLVNNFLFRIVDEARRSDGMPSVMVGVLNGSAATLAELWALVSALEIEGWPARNGIHELLVALHEMTAVDDPMFAESLVHLVAADFRTAGKTLWEGFVPESDEALQYRHAAGELIEGVLCDLAVPLYQRVVIAFESVGGVSDEHGIWRFARAVAEARLAVLVNVQKEG